MVQFHHINKYYAALAVSGVLCACSIAASGQVKTDLMAGDTLATRREGVYSIAPKLRLLGNNYEFGTGAIFSNHITTSKHDIGLSSAAVIPPMPSLKNLSAKSLLSPQSSFSPTALSPANMVKQPAMPGSLATGKSLFTNVFSTDTSKKTADAKLQLPTAAGSVPSVKSLIPANNASAVQNITNMPLQSVKGISGLANGNDQVKRLAAMRSQLISESITKNFSSLHHPSFGSELTLENDFLYQPVVGSIVGKRYFDVVGVSGNLMAFGLPLSINISNERAALGGASPLNNSLFKFGFSPSMLSGLLKSDLQQYADLKNSVFHGFDFTDYVHQTLTEKINAVENGSATGKNSPFAPYLNDPVKLQGLMSMNDKQIQQQLETSVNEKYLDDIKNPNADKEKALAERSLNYQKADSIATVINAIRMGLKKNGASPDKLMLAENFLSGKTSSSFNSSEAANSLFTKKPGGMFQSLFGTVKDLRVGSFGNQVPGGTGDDAQLMNGASLGIKLGDYPLTFGYGSLNDISSMKDAGYDNSVYASPRNITYIGTEMKRGVFGDVKVAVVSSFNTQPNSTQYDVPTLPGNAVAITVTKALKIDKIGNFAFDVSKSGTLFSSSFQPGGEALLERKAGANSNLTNNLFQALALGFTHNLDIPRLQASDNVYFDYAGLGYQNPANNGYSGATVKFGGDLRKSFYQNKLTVDFRSDFRNMPLSYATSDKWKNYQVVLDSRYQFSNKLNMDLKFTDAATNRVISGQSVSVYESKKVEISGNNTMKIGKYFTTTHLSISTQALTNTYESASGSNLININYAQSLMLKNSSLTATLFYNKELSSYVLIGDMLTTDLTYQFVLFKNIQLASGVTYLNNSTIARQVGVRQGLQVMAGKHFDFNASVDLRRNLITPQYADLYASCRGELSVKYYFKID